MLELVSPLIPGASRVFLFHGKRDNTNTIHPHREDRLLVYTRGNDAKIQRALLSGDMLIRHCRGMDKKTDEAKGYWEDNIYNCSAGQGCDDTAPLKDNTHGECHRQDIPQ